MTDDEKQQQIVSYPDSIRTMVVKMGTKKEAKAEGVDIARRLRLHHLIYIPFFLCFVFCFVLYFIGIVTSKRT